MANVIVYSTPTCPYCKLAKEYMTEKGVAFTNVDVSSDPAKAEEMIKKSGQMGVPVIDVDGKIIVGFDKEGLKAALKLA
jgi:glutaredoxin-like YruB-family protein